MVLWILCPNLRGARLFEYSDLLDSPPRFVRELPRPKKQLRYEDFSADDDIPELTESPEIVRQETEVAKEFSSFLSQHLENASKAGRFDSLMICAEEHLLEILLRQLSARVRSKVIGTIDLDLYHVNETDLVPYAKDILDRKRTAA